MAGYLIAEEGPLVGLVVNFEEGNEWVLGRNPDESTIILEDPRVSRKHVICRLTQEGYLLENLSSVNPSTQNGKIITEPVLLKEGDILQIGSTYFRFTEKSPSPAVKENAATPVEGEHSDELSFSIASPTRWLLKVISGPNTGAEFALSHSTSYILGKDTELSDVVFHDLSVSRQHAKITVDDKENVFIEDLKSRNGVMVNGASIAEKKELSSQDLVALGTTSFLIIDQEQVHETIVSPSMQAIAPAPAAAKEEEAIAPVAAVEATAEAPAAARLEAPKPARSWKELQIPTKHLVIAGTFGLTILFMVTATLSLFKTTSVSVHIKPNAELVNESMISFPSVQFSYNEASGKLFLIGHLLTSIEKQELLYTLSAFPFIKSVEDTIIIDELVWQNMNALLQSNTDWQAVTIYAPTPGHFVAKGYVQTLEQAQMLSEYFNYNFPYPNLLDNQVVIGNNLTLQVQSLLTEQNFLSVTFNLSGGELVLSGRVNDDDTDNFAGLIQQIQAIPGIRIVKNFVVYSTATNSRVDISSQYTVTGFSMGNNNDQFVVINHKIFSVGDFLQGMQITEIQPNVIFLEKDGIKFRINYNLQ
jgi:type III secretion system YscD/HrpQ family protein